MKHVTLGLLIGGLVLGGLVLPAEARGRHHGHHGRHHRHHHGHFAGGFLAGAATFLAVDALRTPRVVYTSPVVHQPVYYRAPVCRDIWVPGRRELRPRHQNGFTTYYHVWVDGHWQRQCH
ncbi:MAG: hypothetical protein V3U42_09150 [candidate division NC10 bacterium]|nr:hypothetical protein [candidate division NC10 bacterium]MCZ6550103.1 hypothetical protein [candidate division NC10 bacterium]